MARLEAAKKQGDKTGRSRRWSVATTLLLRALKYGKLAAFVLVNGQPQPLDPTFWRQWVNTWRPFAVNPLGKKGEPKYLLRLKDFGRWNVKHGQPDLSRISDMEAISHQSIPRLALAAKKRGPKGQKKETVKAKMKNDLATGQFTNESLEAEKEEALRARYGASRDTVRKARNELMSELNSHPNSNKAR
jgi:hypothetical protein